ncbi:hypothetical protein [Enterococcus sp. AZ072]|uniref:hypothetical protein n=1 Tax=unclassified Enterococcus TaxID=2608891 RepID=UPI003D2A8339
MNRMRFNRKRNIPDNYQEALSLLRVREISEELKNLPKGSIILSKKEAKEYLSQESNILEIKLKDTDSVPEVYYKGQRLDKFPCGLVDITYHWKTTGFTEEDIGANDIAIEYYSSPDVKYPNKVTIMHKRG